MVDQGDLSAASALIAKHSRKAWNYIRGNTSDKMATDCFPGKAGMLLY
jgi:hypothetical protein